MDEIEKRVGKASLEEVDEARVSRPVGGLHGVGEMGEGHEETKPWEPEPDEQRMEEGYEERTRVLSVLELEELFQSQSPDLNG